MGVLGRGLASLIPNRSQEEDYEDYDDDEILEEHDVAEEEVVAGDMVSPVEDVPAKTLAVLEDFDEIDEMEDEPAPQKPLVTPIPFDMETLMQDVDPAPIAQEEPVKKTLQVQAEEEEMQPMEPEEVAPAHEHDMEEDEDEAPIDEIDMGIPPIPVAVPPQSTQKKVAAVAKEVPRAAAAIHQRGMAMPSASRVAPVKATKKPVEKSDSKPRAVTEETSAVESLAEVSTIVGDSWDQHEEAVQHIAIGDISINPLQPRRSFDPVELEELKDSIERHGILQPLVVRRVEKGYELIAGERRLRASKSLGWTKVPCVVRRDVHADQSRLVYALIENIQRENLNPMEEARAYEQLNKEYGLTHEEIGQRVGKSRVRITNAMRVLHLPAEIQRGLSENKITMGHAKAILMIPDPEKQLRFYQHMMEEGLTVRKAETRARRIQRSMNITDAQRRRMGTRHPLAMRYTPMLEDRYGYDAKVKFVEAKNRFEVVFKAHNQQEMEELCGRLLGTVELPSVDEFE